LGAVMGVDTPRTLTVGDANGAIVDR
jgi:hypothetical protein